MASTSSCEFQYLDTAVVENSNFHDILAGEATQIPDGTENSEVFNVPTEVDDSISGLMNSLSYPGEHPGPNHEWAGICDPFMDELYHLIASDNGKKTPGGLRNENSTSPCEIYGEKELYDVPPDADWQGDLIRISKGAGIPPKKRRRRQYHSCDPCRLAKRGCDLPIDISIQNRRPVRGCTTCKIRDLECTVAWLDSKQDIQHIKKRGRTASHISHTHTNMDTQPRKDDNHQLGTSSVFDELDPLLVPEAELARQVTARETHSQQFRLYIDVWDVPMTNCLSHPCIPPSYPGGVDGLAYLGNSTSFSEYFGQAQSWISTCWKIDSASWEPTSAAPHLFFTVSVLDTLFENRSGQPNTPSRVASDTSISEAYAWVARATAAQFAVTKNRYGIALPHAQDTAIATWRKARKLVLENMAAIDSFRLALSLLLLGLILPPTQAKESHARDADYFHCEGVRRLQTLCADARVCCSESSQEKGRRFKMGMRRLNVKPHPILRLPAVERERISELIASVEWLANIANWVRISISRGRVCAIPPLADDHSATIHSTTNPIQNQIPGSTLPSQTGQSFFDTVVTQAKGEMQSVTVLWSRGVEEDHLLHAVQRSATLVIHLYKSLATLTLIIQDLEDGEVDYEEIARHCTAMATLAELWRLAFGTMSENTKLSLEHLSPSLRNGILFCSNDGDVAVLLFCEMITQLQNDLTLQPSAPTMECLVATLQPIIGRCKEHRLESAMKVSFLASNSLGMSSPGFQGKSGLRASVEDIAAHPVSATNSVTGHVSDSLTFFIKHPYLVVQALTLAAKVFNEEIHSCINQMDTKRASEMTRQLETCLSGLQKLRETLVMFSDGECKDQWD